MPDVISSVLQAPPRSTPISPSSIPAGASNDTLRELLRQRQAQSAAEKAIRGALPATPPSSASVPPTPLTSGIRPAGGIPTGSVPTPVAEIPIAGGIPGGVVRPSLPIGRIAGGAAVGGVIDFGSRLASGQSLGHAALGASASSAGSIALGAVGFALGGPPGALIGGMLGSAIGGAAFDLLNPPSSTEAQPPYQPVSGASGQQYPTPQAMEFYSPTFKRVVGIYWVFGFFIVSKGSMYKGVRLTNDLIVFTHTLNPQSPASYNPSEAEMFIEGGLNFPNGLANPLPESPGADRRSIPRGAPASPAVASPIPGVSLPASPGASVRPGGPKNISPAKTADAPGTNLGGNLPALEPVQAPGQTAAPGLTNPLQTPIPQGNNRGSFAPSLGGLSSPSPDRLGETSKPTSQPQTVKMTTVTPDSQKPPAPTTPTPEQSNDDITKKLEDMNAQLVAMGTAIATLLAKPLNPTSPIDLNSTDFENAVARGNCRTTQPGGCMRKEFDDLGNQNLSNSNKLDNLLNLADLGGSAALGAKLDKIDTKLGPQIPDGGVSGLLSKVSNLVGKTWDFLQIDRVLAVLTWIGTLHNAYMLSNNISQTLFSAIGNILDVFGIEDKEGGALDVGKIVSGWTESFFKKIFGAAAVDQTIDLFKKANRVYQAASNVLWSLQSIADSSRNLTQIAIENTGKIGNALKRAGVVFENAYSTLTERATARTANQKRMDDIIAGLQGIETAVSLVDQTASEVLSIQQTVEELKGQRKELDDSVNDFKNTLNQQDTQAKTISQSPELTRTDFKEAPST